MRVSSMRWVAWHAKNWAFVALCLSQAVAQDEERKGADEDSDHRVFIGNADGSGMKPLVDLGEYRFQGAPVWSSDGTKVAFHALRPGRGEKDPDAQIVVVNADGSNPQILGDGQSPSFSPRHQRIVFTRFGANHGVWVMSLDGPEKELVRIDDSYGAGRWSPDGKKIAYTTTREKTGINIYIYDLIEGDEYPIFDDGKCPYTSFFRNIIWSPDGTKIAFRGQRRGKQTMEVAIVDARGTQHGHTVRYEAKTLYTVQWNHDGTRLLFAQPVAGGSRVQLFSLSASDEKPPELWPGQDPTRGNSNGVISPDGKKILMVSRKPVVELAKDKAKKE